MDLVEQIRKQAHIERGRRLMETEASVPALARVYLEKAARADQRLLKIAACLPGDVFRNYEILGGTFKKEAIGAPMFTPPPQLTQPLGHTAMSQKVAPQAPSAPQQLQPQPQQGQQQPRMVQTPPTAGQTPRFPTAESVSGTGQNSVG